MDYDKLIERLKNWDGVKPDREIGYAITGLDALLSENLQLRNTANVLRADLARVTAERDAAVECLKNKCPFCRKYLTCHGRTINNDCWEFFGAKED